MEGIRVPRWLIMSFEGWLALSLAGCGLTFALQNDFGIRIIGLSLFASALTLAMVAT
jgi:hypothetical protein